MQAEDRRAEWERLVRESVEVRRNLHLIPEISWQEEKTSAMIGQVLDSHGVVWQRTAGTGIVARFAQKAQGEHLAFRADIDGLPLVEHNDVAWRSLHEGRMHACGHDGHTATLLLLAAWLRRCEDQLPGPVTLLFQPAEEGGFGAREMITQGALQGIERVFGWHNWPSEARGRWLCGPGPVMAANASFQIVIEGKGGHASQPESCQDPVLAAAAVTLGLQQLVSRRLPPQEAVVISVTSIDTQSGETIIADRVRLHGTIRLHNSELLALVGQLLVEVAENIARGYNTAAKVSCQSRYPALCNEGESARRMARELAAVFGPTTTEAAIRMPLMASEDFSFYLAEVPGAFALVGGGPDQGPLCHNHRYDFDDELLEPMARVMIRLAGLPDPVTAHRQFP